MIHQPALFSDRFLAFDLEIATPIPDMDGDWKASRPLGISCAATLSSEGELQVWHGAGTGGQPAERMSRAECAELVSFLQQAAAGGAQVLTWNGLGFDFDILAEESGEAEACQTLAWNHVDMMFHFFCLQGYPLALDTAARGMGVAGKTPGMSGDQAPILWQQGQRQKVLEYVAQDVRATLAVAQAALKNHKLVWTSKTGRLQQTALPHGWLPARMAAQLPEPDTSWMNRPLKRSRFTGWMQPG